MNYFVIGTAGHVDHGKTALIKALTGIDCDRLKEEKQRGMTIDIGFSYCNLANGDCVEIIDVPGHERFIKNMLAGTGAIDAVLLVIAANEGVMPQTREHLGILTLLGIKNGIVVITKVDLVETEWLELVKEEIRGAVKGTFLEKAEIIEVSAITGQGMQRLKSGIEGVCRHSAPKDETAPFRLPIDRVFIKEGSGTIVTGTVISGTFKTGDELEVFPSRNKVRVRQIGTHNLKIEQGKAGQRVGFNLVGVKKEELMRGNILAEPGYLHPSTRIDARIRLLPSCPRILKNGSRIRLYLGTGEFLGRVFLLDKPEIKPNETGLAQLRMDAALAAVKGERFVLRFYAPMVTIGGGEIIDPAPQSHRRFDKSVISLLQEFEGMSPQQIGPAQARLAQKLLKENIVKALTEFHRKYPLRGYISKEELKSRLPGKCPDHEFKETLKELSMENAVDYNQDRVRLFTHTVGLSAQQNAMISRVEAILSSKLFAPPDIKGVKALLNDKPQNIEEIFSYLTENGRIVPLSGDIVLHRQAIQQAEALIKDYLHSKNEMAVSDCTKLLNTSRKYALPILQYFDNMGLTRRAGDKRMLARG